MSCKSLGEFAILFSSRYIFGNCEIVNFQTQTGEPACIGILYTDEAFLPVFRKRGSVRTHALGVIAVGSMKSRSLSNCAIYAVGPLRSRQRIEVGLHGSRQYPWRFGKLTENGLAADDYQFTSASNFSGSTNQVLKIGTRHKSVAVLPK